jgi:hypothetical protein
MVPPKVAWLHRSDYFSQALGELMLEGAADTKTIGIRTLVFTPAFERQHPEAAQVPPQNET